MVLELPNLIPAWALGALGQDTAVQDHALMGLRPMTPRQSQDAAADMAHQELLETPRRFPEGLADMARTELLVMAAEIMEGPTGDPRAHTSHSITWGATTL